MTDVQLQIVQLPEREQNLINRSVCHIADETLLPEALRLGNRVTDLDVARLLLAVERGFVVVPRDETWTDLTGALRARMRHLTRVANECIRLRLLVRTTEQITVDIWRTRLVAAPVHLMAGPNRPACPAPGGMVRYRLSDDRNLIDCPACLDPDR